MQSNVCVVDVSGPLTLSGAAITLGNAAGGTRGQLVFVDGAAQTVDGADAAHPGTIVLGARFDNGLFDSGPAGGSFTVGANLTIKGADGQVNSQNNPMTIKGTVLCDPTAVGLTSGTVLLNGTG
jgi:hypothetical protein